MSDHDNDTCPHLVRASLLESENARLKAEVERLETFGADATLDNRILETDNTRLKAEVERLTKAGDDLYKSMLEIGCNEMADNFQYDAWWGSMKAWNAAKEGKPSV
jgi:hypothetical protein